MSIEQLTIFDLLNNEEALPRNIKLLSLFSGIGAFEKALYNLGISYELINYCEIDKYASKSYSAIHGVSEAMNLWDVTKIIERDLPKDIDLLTYGFPCQDISLAGKQKGLFNDDGTKTRSGLFFDALRCIEAAQPRVAIAENVKNLTGKKFNAQFQVVLASLEAAGYNNYWAVLNLKNFGIPQNRERVFIVSIYKDLDKGLFEFPKGFPLEKRLKDVLEDTVDESFYLTAKQLNYAIDLNDIQKGTKWEGRCNDGKLNPRIASTLGVRSAGGNQRIGVSNFVADGTDEEITAKDYKNYVRQIGQIYSGGSNPQSGRVYDVDGISPTMDTCSGGNRMPKVALAYDEQNGYIHKDGTVGTITTDGSSPKHNNRVLVYDGYNQRIRADQSCVGTITQNVGKDLKRNGQGIIEPAVLQLPRGKNKGGIKEISPTLTSNAWEQNNFCAEKQIQGSLRIRKLTPKECWRLMGFDDSDFHKAELVNSNTQLYKQAGNSIGVPVIEYIIKQLLKCEIWE